MSNEIPRDHDADIKLTMINERVKTLENDLHWSKKKIDAHVAMEVEFQMVKKLVFGTAGLVWVGFFATLVNFVLDK